MKKELGSKLLVFPMPVLMIGTYDEAGVPNLMNAAWGGPSEADEISICIDPGHKTWENLKKTQAFTVAMGTEKTVAQCDYVGIVSGKDEADKVAKAGFTAVKSAHVNAPVMQELPLVLECRLVEQDDETCRVRGKIVNASADESILTDGKVDIGKLQPISFDTVSHSYVKVGGFVAKAFSCGAALK